MSVADPLAAARAIVPTLHGRLRADSATLAVAESLTGGLLAVLLTDVAGASVTFRGGVVAYATELKASLLDVPAALLAERGAVDPEVAVAMAAGAARRLDATYGLATTGVAGPDPQDGKPVGTVYVAASRRDRAEGAAAPVDDVRACRFTGGRAEIRAAAVTAALELIAEVVESSR